MAKGNNRKDKQKKSHKNNVVNRTFKSTVFIMLFEDRDNLLELYNAMTRKHYTDLELLEINTLKNAIYMSMKNDLSFLIDGRLSLYEHQSTYNLNLPLRFLFYISQLASEQIGRSWSWKQSCSTSPGTTTAVLRKRVQHFGITQSTQTKSENISKACRFRMLWTARSKNVLTKGFWKSS